MYRLDKVVQIYLIDVLPANCKSGSFEALKKFSALRQDDRAF